MKSNNKKEVKKNNIKQTEQPIELTWSELYNRLKFLYKNYGTYNLMMNMSSKYAPKQVKQICVFKGIDKESKQEKSYSAFTSIKDMEVFNSSLDLLIDTILPFGTIHELRDDKAVIYGNSNRTSTICGVHVDNDTKSIVLLNGWFNSEPVDWSSIKDNIY